MKSEGLRVPLVEGEAVTPFVRLATICDFASGTGNALDFARFTSINPDLSLHVLREPRGEWIGLRARSGIEADGIGQSHATLFDDEGPVRARWCRSWSSAGRSSPLR